MKIATTFVAFFLLLLGCAYADGNIISRLSEYGVVESMNSYMLDFNRLVEYANPGVCNSSAVNFAALSADAAAFVDKYFSKDIRTYWVLQSTKATEGTPKEFLVLNYTVGLNYATSLDLHNWLKIFYAAFIRGGLSSPFWWVMSAPVVQSIDLRDANYDRESTALFTANNVNQGFQCRNINGTVVRRWRIQMSQYQHKLIYDENSGSWKFVEFGERNNGQVVQDGSLYTQLNP